MDIQSRIEQLKSLKEAGHIDDQEYQRRHQQLLDQLTGAPASAAQDETLMGFVPEQVVGPPEHPFKLLHPLGGGGMGQVWKAVDLECKKRWPNRDCLRALKFPPLIWMNDERFKETLKREADAAKELDCPHTVKVHGWHEQSYGEGVAAGSHVFIEMEYLEGADLKTRLEKDWTRGLPFDRAMEIILPVAQALDCAHQRYQLIHRDLKPANIFLTREGIKVLDFGIADEFRRTATSQATHQHQAPRSSGTPGYMAPEVSTRRPEPRQDVHALACVVYELLTGRPPFYITPETPRQEGLLPEKPEGLTDAAWEVLKKGFAYEVEQRPASAGDLVTALDEAQSRSPHEAQRNAGKEDDPKFPDSAKGAIQATADDDNGGSSFAWGKAMAGLVVVMGLGGAWWIGGEDPVPPPDATTGSPHEAKRNVGKKEAPPDEAAGEVAEGSAPQIADVQAGSNDVQSNDEKNRVSSEVQENGNINVEEKEASSGALDSSAKPKDSLAKKLFEEAYALQFKKRQPDKAFPLYLRAAELGHPLAMGMLASEYANGKRVQKDMAAANDWYRKSIDTIKKMASDSDEYADYTLAKMFYYVKQDYGRAAKYAKKAAMRGSSEAMTTLGFYYLKGKGINQDDRKAVEWYRKAAEKGDAVAMRNLGRMYAEGRGVAKNEEKAVEWYRKAAEKGDGDAMWRLGWAYQNGRGVVKDDREAVKWYRKAAEKGNGEGMRLLGDMYAGGRGIVKNEKKAVEWYRKAAEKGNSAAMWLLGWMYKEGRGVAQDDKKAVEWYRKAAEKGNSVATRLLGDMYAEGRGIAKNEKKAVEWYRKAAEKGDSLAMWLLGWMYKEGRGVAQDDKKAVEWYRKAAEKGNSAAMWRLGWAYQYGKGIVKDDREAVKWYRKAAEKGHAHAMMVLGWMYGAGRGIVQDDKKAVEWYRKAAEKGNSEAMWRLGWMYGAGRGVAQDDGKAVQWYKKSAQKGDSEAMRLLGYRYEKGLGVEKNEEKAMEWFRKSADLGNADGKAALNRLLEKKKSSDSSNQVTGHASSGFRIIENDVMPSPEERPTTSMDVLEWSE